MERSLQTAKPPANVETGGFAFSPNDAGLGQAFLGVPNWGASF
jgi:hypothetical protein